MNQKFWVFCISLLISTSLLAQFRCQALKQQTNSSIPPGTSIDNSAKSDTFNILHYDLFLDFTTLPSRYLAGRADLTITPKIVHNGVINLDLLQLQVDSILQDGQTISFSHNDTIIRANLINTPPPGDTFTLSVYYRGNPPGDGSGWGGWHQQSGYYYNLGVGFAANPHTYGRAWHPCFDNFVEKATYDFQIKTRGNIRAYCNGLRISETALNGDTLLTHWAMTDSIPTYLASIAMSNYAEVNDSVSGLLGTTPIQLMAKPADSLNLVNSFVNLKPTFTALENAFGPYYWQKIGYAATTVGAMEHATSIHYPVSLINGNLSGEDIMAHELAHHWWGNLVTCETDADMWINEGMAEYCSHLYTEQVYNRETYLDLVLANAFTVLETAHKNDNGYKSIEGLSHEYTYGTHVYQKGAMVAHNLRAYLGDSLFFNGLTTLLENNKYGNLNSAQFRDELSQITGVPLNDFFTNWVYNAGYPQVTVDHWTASATDDITVQVSQRVHEAPALYQGLPVFVTFFNAAGDTLSHQLEMNGANATRTFHMPGFQPVFALAGYNGKMLSADTYDEFKITQSGPLAEKYSKLRFTVNSVQDSAHVIAMHHYAGPGGVIPAWADFHLSINHYWTVGIIGEERIDLSARMDYRGGTNGMDDDLVSITEDSLQVLWRKDASQPWEIYPYQTRTDIGGPSNGLGWFTLDSLRQGDYVLANSSETIGRKEPAKRQGAIDIFPNPAGDRIHLRLRQEELESYTIKVMDMGGQIVHQQNWKPLSLTDELAINLSGLRSDYVIVQVGEQKEKVMLAR